MIPHYNILFSSENLLVSANKVTLTPVQQLFHKDKRGDLKKNNHHRKRGPTLLL